MQWLQEAEIKHCRICMLAFVGIWGKSSDSEGTVQAAKCKHDTSVCMLFMSIASAVLLLLFDTLLVFYPLGVRKTYGSRFSRLVQKYRCGDCCG